MTEQEANNWKRAMMQDAGHWTVDPCHATAEDFLAYVPHPDDPTTGIYLAIRGRELTCGTFEHAYPHIGEATFTVKTRVVCDDPLAHAIERLGLGFLMAVTFGRSPYRVL